MNNHNRYNYYDDSDKANHDLNSNIKYMELKFYNLQCLIYSKYYIIAIDYKHLVFDTDKQNYFTHLVNIRKKG